MNNLKVNLKLFPVTQLSYSSASQQEQSSIEKLSEVNKIGFRGLYLTGGSKDYNDGCWLDGTFHLFDESGYPGWVGSDLSKADGTFEQKQSIQLSSTEDFANLMIFFDPVAGEYAESFKLDGIIYSNDSYVRYFSGPFTNNVELEIIKWSRTNSFPKILAVSSGLEKVYDYKQLINIMYTNEITSAQDILLFGVTTQTGTVSLRDKRVLREINDNRKLETQFEVQIIEDVKTLDEQGEPEVIPQVVETLYVSEIENERNKDLWTFSLVDKTAEWDEEQFEGLEYSELSLKDIIDSLIPEAIYVGEADDIKNMQFVNAYMNPSTKREALDKCCQVGLLRIYQENKVTYVRRLI